MADTERRAPRARGRKATAAAPQLRISTDASKYGWRCLWDGGCGAGGEEASPAYASKAGERHYYAKHHDAVTVGTKYATDGRQ